MKQVFDEQKGFVCGNCGSVVLYGVFHSCPVHHETKDELIAEYERLVLPRKIKEATDKLNKQWTHALSTSNRRAKAIAARDKEWVEWFEKNIKCHQIKGYTAFCIDSTLWQERKKEIGL